MIVFIAGMPRSGSTFCFNVVREVLSRRGKVHQAAVLTLAEARSLAGDAAHIVFKAHATDDDTVQLIRSGEIKAILTLRERPEDAVASWIDTFGFTIDEAVAAFLGWFALHDRIKDCCLKVSYDQIDTNPRDAAITIARYIEPSVTLTEILDIAARHGKEAIFEQTKSLPKDAPGVKDVGFSHYDTATFYHRRHVSQMKTRSAAERISPEVVSFIRGALRDYIDDEGRLR